MAGKHQYHFRSRIPPEAIEEAAEAGGFDSMSEYFRSLVRDDLSERGLLVGAVGE